MLCTPQAQLSVNAAALQQLSGSYCTSNICLISKQKSFYLQQHSNIKIEMLHKQHVGIRSSDTHLMKNSHTCVFPYPEAR